jgi:hypothetical protein
MFDIAKSIRDIDDTVKRNAAVADLWEQILTAQQRYAAALDQIGVLEKEMAALKAWGAEKERYELADVGDGTFAYALKPSMRGTEPPHYLCAHCYQQGKKAILQHMETHGMGDLLTCPSCKTKSLISRSYKAP